MSTFLFVFSRRSSIRCCKSLFCLVSLSFVISVLLILTSSMLPSLCFSCSTILRRKEAVRVREFWNSYTVQLDFVDLKCPALPVSAAIPRPSSSDHLDTVHLKLSISALLLLHFLVAVIKGYIFDTVLILESLREQEDRKLRESRGGKGGGHRGGNWENARKRVKDHWVRRHPDGRRARGDDCIPTFQCQSELSSFVSARHYPTQHIYFSACRSSHQMQTFRTKI